MESAVDSRSRLSAGLAERYTISRELGRGGMATVYLAHDRKHDRQVALKLLHPELAASIGAERFLHEIRTTAKLTHPYILPLHDSGEADGLLYYVMPYVEGESLRQRLIRERQLPLDDALRIASDVASALAYAHDHGVVHRDIKPENILLSGGEAVVADFGIARAITAAGGERLTETGLAVGTVAYMSPEQSAADREIDGRSDLYSLGCVLYEMLAGQPPFTGPTAQAIVARRLSEPVPALHHVREQVPLPVEQALMKAMAKVPADRFSSASRFAEALAAASRPVPQRRAPRQTVVWAMLALLLATLAGYFVLRPRPAQSTLSAPIAMAVLPFRAVASTEPVDFLSVGIPDAIITRLANVGQMRVRPTSAVLRYEHQPVDAVEAGRALAADYVLTGTVQRAAARIRVNVQLVRAGDGVPLWGEQYDLARQDLLTLQDSIAAQVASALEVRMTAAEQERVYRRYTENIGAFEAYMRGRPELARGTKEGALAAILAFEDALRQDSTYALARAGLAMASADMHLRFSSSDDVHQWGERARGEAQRALALDSNLAETHQALAAVYGRTEFNWERVIEESRRALALNPSLELPYYYLARALHHLGLLQSADSVLGEAPIAGSENRSERLRTKGVTALLAGRYAEAASLLSEVRRLRSGLSDSYLAQSYYYAGDRQRGEALLDSLRHSPAIAAATRARATLASFLAARGDSVNARALLDEVDHGSYMDHHVAYSVGAAHAQLGDHAQAHRWLTQAVETGFPSYPWYARDPLLQPFRASQEGATFLSTLRQSGEATKRRLELGWRGTRD
jgi:eukaryotic-like serine/threonine-protein kinase